MNDQPKDDTEHLLSSPANAAHLAASMAQLQGNDELIIAHDVEAFANMITAWHSANVEVLKKMRDIPGDGGLTFSFEDKEHVMQGDIHTGYRMGIHAALGLLGTLPFVEVPDPAPTQASNDDEPAAS